MLEESKKTRFRSVYHGSAADFDKFDHSKMEEVADIDFNVVSFVFGKCDNKIVSWEIMD